MSDGHLYLSAHGCVDYAGDSRHAWYDATHHSVLVLSPRSRKLRQIALDASLDPMEPSMSTSSTLGECVRNVVTLYDFTEPDHPPPARNGGQQKTVRRRSATPILLLQMSVDGQFLAIQRSDIEVQVVHRAIRATYWVLCKSKAGNRILHGGVLWNTHANQASSSQDLFLVTKLGLEHYRVSTKRRSCALHRTMGVYVHAFWYAASHGVLLVSSGSRANEIVPFLLHGANVEKLPRLVFSTSVSSQELHLVCLYGDLYAVYSDTKSTKLLLYLVGRTKVTCVRSLNLMLPPGTALEYSVVDNLLVCHSLDFNVSMFFDIKCEGNVSDPFSAPLPVSSRSPGPHPEDDVGGAMTGSATPDSITRVSSSPSIVDAFEEFNAEAVEVVNDEEGEEEERGVGPMWGSPQATLRIRRALSVDDLEVHKYVEEDTLPSPSFKTSPASHLAKRRSARRLQRVMTAANLGNVEQVQHEVDVPSFLRWRFYAPNFVLRSFTVNGRNDLIEQVEVRKLQVNLSEVCKSCERHPEILPFLLRRGDYVLAKRLILQLVKDHIVEQQATLASIVQLFSIVQTISHSEGNHGAEELYAVGGATSEGGQRAHLDRDAKLGQGAIAQVSSTRMPDRSASGFLLVFQSEFYCHVWSEVVQNSELMKTGRLSIYINEFIKNLRDNMVPVENITYVALAQSFIAAGEPHKLYQFLHYHVLSDSIELADLMVRNGCTYPGLMQVGLDMYYRLGAMNPLVRTLLDLGQTERAIEISWMNMGTSSCDASVIPAVAFFDSFVKSVTTPGLPRSSLQVTQMLGNLLLFLKAWDPIALQCSSMTSLSTLASTASVPFPDHLVAPSCSLKLRSAFGFASE